MNKDKIIPFLISIIILIFFALINKFPLLTADSWVYINSGFEKFVPYDRPLTYGLFLKHTSWTLSLWLVVFTQTFLLSVVWYLFFKYFSKSSVPVLYYLISVFFAVCFTLSSVTTSTVNIYIFSSVAILCMVILFFAGKILQRDFLAIFLILMLCLSVDISILLNAIIFAVIISLFFVLKKNYGYALKRALPVICIAVFSWFLVSFIHYKNSGSFKYIRNSKTIIFSNIVNNEFNDNIKKFIVNENNKNSVLYIYRDSLNKLITTEGKLNSLSLTNNDLYLISKIVNNTLGEKNFKEKFLKKLFLNFFVQLSGFNEINYIKSPHNGSTNNNIESLFKWFNNSVREYFISWRENFLSYKLTFLYYSQRFLIITCLILFIIFLFHKKISNDKTKIFQVTVIAYILQVFINTIIYGNTNISDHIAFVTILPLFLYLSENKFLKNIEIKLYKNEL